MTASNHRVVLDTNQVVGAGSRWLRQPIPTPDPNLHRRLLLCVASRHVGLYCDPIIREYTEKLLDQGHPPPRVRDLITYLLGAFESVSTVSCTAPVPPTDPDDEIFLICAIDGAADYLVSEDHHLVCLRDAYQQPVIGRSSELIGILDPP